MKKQWGGRNGITENSLEKSACFQSFHTVSCPMAPSCLHFTPSLCWLHKIHWKMNKCAPPRDHLSEPLCRNTAARTTCFSSRRKMSLVFRKVRQADRRKWLLCFNDDTWLSMYKLGKITPPSLMGNIPWLLKIQAWLRNPAKQRSFESGGTFGSPGMSFYEVGCSHWKTKWFRRRFSE